MKTIKLEDYNESMGTLISLVDNDDFKNIKGCINISLSKLLDNPSKYLDKDKTYFFYCLKGKRSTRAVQILTVYGYNCYKVVK